jgi:hypothetical protein
MTLALALRMWVCSFWVCSILLEKVMTIEWLAAGEEEISGQPNRGFAEPNRTEPNQTTYSFRNELNQTAI